MKDFAELFGLAAIGSHNTTEPLEQKAVPSQGDPWAWKNHALCRPPKGLTDDELRAHVNRWYPARGENHMAELRAICAQCPVINECRTAAMAEAPGDMHGFRAGMTPRERRRARQDNPPETSRDKVARLVALGWTDERVGQELGLTRHCVKWHRQALGIKKDNHGRPVNPAA